jgi:non-ribosomal peptide synthase protein (TIGR01720 family)
MQPAPAESTHDQSASTPLTPIQRWFFDRNPVDPHHFNQSVVLETPAGIDPPLIERALAALVEHHEALRLRYQFEDGQVVQRLATVSDAPAMFTIVDLSALSPTEQQSAILERSSSLQASLDLTRGPLVTVAYFDCGPSRAGQLLVVIHHLVVDGVSWRILIEDLEVAYQQLRAGQPVQLPPGTMSFMDWSHRSQEYAQTVQVGEELRYWREQLSGPRLALPSDRPDRVSSEAEARMVEALLSIDETRAILREVPRALRARINAILLAALVRSVAEWTGQPTLVVNLEGHGREPIAENVDLTRTVGWFTTMYPVALDIRGMTSMTDCVRAVRASLQQIPRQGIGYGLLRYPGQETPAAQELAQYPPPEISFNYLGQFDQLLAEPSTFRLSIRAATGPSHSPRQIRAHVLDVGGIVIDGQLRLTCTYSEGLHAASTIQRLMDSMAVNLRTLVADNQSAPAPSRQFPLAGLDQQQLDSLLGKVRRPANRADG